MNQDIMVRLGRAEKDLLILALRLYGEDEFSHSPETYDVMERMMPVIEKHIKESIK